MNVYLLGENPTLCMDQSKYEGKIFQNVGLSFDVEVNNLFLNRKMANQFQLF